MLEVKIHKEYPDNYFIGCYKLEDALVDDILKWKSNNEHLSKETTSQNKNSNEVSKVCLEWGIPNDMILHPWQNYQKALFTCFKKYFVKYNNARLMHGPLGLENYNLQHYMPGQGFYMWHKENNGEPDVLKRHLVFMTYLTNTPNAGTEFMTQDLTVPCEKGVTLIWPAPWTHTHRGQISLTHEKTIVTGWLRLNS
tara:strand:+ start:515 stop:1102 length:588 start_codon:yes stop_codon:yes gene_type:complete